MEKEKKRSGRIAVPVKEGKLCIHFGKTPAFALFDIREGQVAGIHEVVPPPHAPEVFPRWLGELGVTDVITGGIGQKAIDMLLEEGINVYDGAPVKEVTALVDDLLGGHLENLGNYCDH